MLPFEAAERRADELYTRSLSGEAAALLTSDLALPYRGTPCELQLIHYYRALNYLALDLPDDALVEARKANFSLAHRRERLAVYQKHVRRFRAKLDGALADQGSPLHSAHVPAIAAELFPAGSPIVADGGNTAVWSMFYTKASAPATISWP